MKKSIAIAAMLVVGAGAAGVSAVNLPSPFQGSDTLFHVTQNAITAINTIGPASAYVGGGSGNGQSAMAAGGAADTTATQQIAPMSRMVNNGNSVCLFNGGTAGSNLIHASGIVVGLDAVDVLSSLQSGGQQTGACNLAPNGSAAGSTTGVFANNSAETWKWALALIYGGKDLSNSSAAVDCNSATRLNLVNNWGKLIQGESCSPSTSTMAGSGHAGADAWTGFDLYCSDSSGASCASPKVFASACGTGTGTCTTTHVINGVKVLWHAYRRDEASGTSDVFSSLIGISPSTSNSAVAGFGTSPYCNAMNWDTAAGNANCAYGLHDQFTGPGGVIDPQSTILISSGANVGVGSGNHRKPPPGTWGETPDPNDVGKSAFDVLPTEMQDNDPVRRPCQGNSVGAHKKAGEEVCNIDGNNDPVRHAGTNGLVLPMVDSDFIATLPAPGNQQYPTNACTANNELAVAASVISCPNRTPVPFVSAQCPNGDSLSSGGCVIGTDEVSAKNTSQCLAPSSMVANLEQRSGLYCTDGGGSCTTLNAACGTATSAFPSGSGLCTQLNNFQGRNFNRELRDGNVQTSAGTGVAPGYALVQLPALPVCSVGNQQPCGAACTTAGGTCISTTIPFTGAYYRIHSVETAVADAAPGCQMVDMTDQIGCLTAQDPSSIGYAGDGSKTWGERTNGFPSYQKPLVACTSAANCTTAPWTNCVSGFCSQNTDPSEDPSSSSLPTANAWETTSLNIGGPGAAIAAGLSTVQKLGQKGEYQLSRKLYLNSLIGFNDMQQPGAGVTDPGAPAELILANNEASIAFMDPILTPLSFFPLGFQVTSANGNLCEDFNEKTVCSSTNANVNGCLGNVAPIPGAGANESSICGNPGATSLPPFEECDSVAGLGVGSGCSATCRCNLDFNQTTGACN